MSLKDNLIKCLLCSAFLTYTVSGLVCLKCEKHYEVPVHQSQGFVGWPGSNLTSTVTTSSGTINGTQLQLYKD